jgi:hypothetical protein
MLLRGSVPAGAKGSTQLGSTKPMMETALGIDGPLRSAHQTCKASISGSSFDLEPLQIDPEICKKMMRLALNIDLEQIPVDFTRSLRA